MPILAPTSLNGSFFFLAGNEDNRKGLNEFEFWPDSTTYCGVSYP